MEGLEKELNDLSVKLEGKTSAEIKTSIEAFETKMSEKTKGELDSLKNEMETKLAKVQDHADKLDAKLQSKNMETKTISLAQELKEKKEGIKSLMAGNGM